MRMSCLILFAAIAPLTFSVQAQSAGGGASINKVQERQIFDQTTRVFSDQQATASSTFEAQCVAVLGLRAYCGCLGKEMPAGVGFDNFVVVLTRSKQENGYAQLDTTSRRAYDAIPELRDRCAAGAR